MWRCVHCTSFLLHELGSLRAILRRWRCDCLLQYHRDDVVMTLKRVLAGGLAGMLAKSVVAPVDRVKILFQVTNEKFSFKKVGAVVVGCDTRTQLEVSTRAN